MTVADDVRALRRRAIEEGYVAHASLLFANLTLGMRDGDAAKTAEFTAQFRRGMEVADRALAIALETS